MWKSVVAPTFLVVVFWVATGLATTYYIRWLEQSPAAIVNESMGTIRAATGMRHALAMMERAVSNPGLADNRATTAQVAELEDDFSRQFAEADATSLTPPEADLIKIIREKYPAFHEEVARILKAPAAPELWTPQAMDRIRALGETVAEPCKQLRDLNERLLDQDLAHRAQLSESINRVRLGIFIAVPVIGIAFGLWSARQFRRSISRISITLNDATADPDQPVGRIDIDESGDLTGLHQQVQIVAERIRRVMDDLQKSRREATAAAHLAAIGELALGVAHELRNPLTSVKLLIQKAAQRNTSFTLTDRQLMVVQEEIARMENTIDRLLDFARPAAINQVRHDFRDTVHHATTLQENRAALSDVHVSLDQPSLPVEIQADPDQLHQVLSNLLLNAIEAMPKGGTLRITTSVNTAVTDTCFVRVTDTGCGIAPEIQSRLFEPFVTNKAKGTGLGLAISQRIIKRHGGNLTAENLPGGGAQFTVELPLAKAAGNTPTRRTAISRPFGEVTEPPDSPAAASPLPPEQTYA